MGMQRMTMQGKAGSQKILVGSTCCVSGIVLVLLRGLNIGRNFAWWQTIKMNVWKRAHHNVKSSSCRIPGMEVSNILVTRTDYQCWLSRMARFPSCLSGKLGRSRDLLKALEKSFFQSLQFDRILPKNDLDSRLPPCVCHSFSKRTSTAKVGEVC